MDGQEAVCCFALFALFVPVSRNALSFPYLPFANISFLLFSLSLLLCFHHTPPHATHTPVWTATTTPTKRTKRRKKSATCHTATIHETAISRHQHQRFGHLQTSPSIRPSLQAITIRAGVSSLFHCLFPVENMSMFISISWNRKQEKKNLFNSFISYKPRYKGAEDFFLLQGLCISCAISIVGSVCEERSVFIAWTPG